MELNNNGHKWNKGNRNKMNGNDPWVKLIFSTIFHVKAHRFLEKWKVTFVDFLWQGGFGFSTHANGWTSHQIFYVTASRSGD